MGNVKTSKVLIIDDNTDNYICQRMIEITNFSNIVIIQNTGQDGLEYLRNNESKLDDLPDLIFLDIDMPVVNGYVFLDEFKKFSKALKEKCKIIVLLSTVNYKEGEEIISIDHVMKFIEKPITIKKLEEIKLWLG